MMDEKIIREKLIFLLSSLLSEDYKVLDLELMTYIQKDLILEYSVNVKVDIVEQINPDIDEINRYVKNCYNSIYELLKEFQITKNGKIVRNQNIMTQFSHGVFRIDFVWDEKLICDFTYHFINKEE